MSTAGAAQDPTPISAVMRSIIKSVMSNDVEGVQQALEEGHNIDQFQGPNGMTMLHVAAGSGAADVTRLLIESGMDPLAPNKDGVTPLDMARHAGHPTVATMIENAIRDASEDHLEEVFERLTLQAVVSNDTTNIRQALDAGLRDELFDWRGPNGETYLHLAAAAKTPGVIAENDLQVANQAAAADKGAVAAAESNVHAARDALRSVTQMEAYLTIVAPFSGVVTKRNLHPGALVGPASGQGGAMPIVQIVDTDHLRLVVLFPRRRLAL